MATTRSFLDVTHNSRELGDIPTADGGMLASGVLFRSDALTALTADGLRTLADRRIGTVIDLRSDAERTRAADVLPDDGSVKRIDLPMLGGAMDEMVRRMLPSGEGTGPTAEQVAAIAEQVPTLEELYVSILTTGAAHFAEVARAVLDASTTARPGVLFHCTAGKDRTGLAAAIMLLLAGVPRAAIVADYVESGENLEGAFAEALTASVTAMGVPLTPRLRTLATQTPPAAIEAALDWIESRGGGVTAYLRRGGLTDSELRSVRRIIRGEDAETREGPDAGRGRSAAARRADAHEANRAP